MEKVKRGLTETCYGFFKTIANPTRLAILEKLSNSDLKVTQLTKILKQEQSMISHNLKSLERCKIIYSERKGKTKIYKANKKTVNALFKTVKNHSKKFCTFNENCPYSQ